MISFLSSIFGLSSKEKECTSLKQLDVNKSTKITDLFSIMNFNEIIHEPLNDRVNFHVTKSDISPLLKLQSLQLSNRIDLIKEKFSLPDEWSTLYSTLDLDERDISMSLKKGNLIFYSVKDIETQISRYNKFVDLAVLHEGFGYVWVLTWDPKTKQSFIRSDGGSNNLDRLCNYNYYIAGNKFDISDDKYADRRNSFMDSLINLYNNEFGFITSQ
jgi:hypothetical protein